jgi:type III restriction enzyme
VRPSQVVYELTSHLVLQQVARRLARNRSCTSSASSSASRASGSSGYLVCKGGTYPAQLKYKMLADMAASASPPASRAALGQVAPDQGGARPLQPDRQHTRTSTSTPPRPSAGRPRTPVPGQLGDLDSDWEAEFCRVAEKHPRVRAYVKNHNLGLEVPYRYGSETRKYRPDFIVQDRRRHGDDDLLNLIVEIKGYRGEDAKEKKSTMDTYWVPGVNHLGSHGRWAFAEFTDVMQHDFAEKLQQAFGELIKTAVRTGVAQLHRGAEQGEDRLRTLRACHSRPFC